MTALSGRHWRWAKGAARGLSNVPLHGKDRRHEDRAPGRETARVTNGCVPANRPRDSPHPAPQAVPCNATPLTTPALVVWYQDAVRGDHGDLATLLIQRGGKVRAAWAAVPQHGAAWCAGKRVVRVAGRSTVLRWREGIEAMAARCSSNYGAQCLVQLSYVSN